MIIGYLLSALGIFILYYPSHQPFKFTNALIFLGLTLYPGWFASWLIAIILEEPVEYFIYKFHKLRKLQFREFNIERRNILSRKSEIEKKIKRIQEFNLSEKVEDLLSNIISKKIEVHMAHEMLKSLQEENIEIRKGGYQIHTSVHYTNRFAKIKQALAKWQKSIEPNSYTSLSTTSAEAGIIQSKSQAGSRYSQNVNEKSKDSSALKRMQPTSKKSEQPYGKTEEELSPSEIKNIPSPNTKTNTTVTESTISSEKDKRQPSPIGVEENDDELFSEGGQKEEIEEGHTKKHQPKTPIKLDFPVLNEHRHNIGRFGELYIFEKEKNYLNSSARINQGREVVHVSLISDSEGYDIISFTMTGERKYIEVKTTTGDQYEPFYLSINEMEAMKSLSNYWIYRVYNFNIESKIGDLYKIDCSKGLENYYHIKASTFKISPKYD